MNWTDLLMLIPRGLKAAAGAVASPFTSNDSYSQGFAANDPAGEMGGGQDKSGTLSSILKALGNVGETAGRVGNTVGRMLPIVGPYYQGAEYGVLKGLGKEDSDWAGGNIFAEAEKAREARQRARDFKDWSMLADKERFGWEQGNQTFAESKRPYEMQGLEQGLRTGEQAISLNDLRIGNEETTRDKLALEMERLQAEKQAVINKYGSLDNYEGQKLLDAEKELQLRYKLLESQANNWSSLAGYRDTKGVGGMTEKDRSLIYDRAVGNAQSRANSAVPEIMRVSPEGRKLWEDKYNEFLGQELSQYPSMQGFTNTNPNNDPENTVTWFKSQVQSAMADPAYQGMGEAQVAQTLYDSMKTNDPELMSALTADELELIKSLYGLMDNTGVK